MQKSEDKKKKELKVSKIAITMQLASYRIFQREQSFFMELKTQRLVDRVNWYSCRAVVAAATVAANSRVSTLGFKCVLTLHTVQFCFQSQN